MDMKLAASLSVVGVVAAGTAAMAVNTQVLTSSPGSPVGSASAPGTPGDGTPSAAPTPRPTITKVKTTVVARPVAVPNAAQAGQGDQSGQATQSAHRGAAGRGEDPSARPERTHSGDDDGRKHPDPTATRSHDDDEYESEHPDEHETESPEPSETETHDDHGPGGDDD